MELGSDRNVQIIFGLRPNVLVYVLDYTEVLDNLHITNKLVKICKLGPIIKFI